MLIRWSDQEDPTNWTPAATNQAGSIRLSKGTEIVTAKQSRQEILVWTDSSVYSLQYQGAPIVWSTQLVGDNISIASQNAGRSNSLAINASHQGVSQSEATLTAISLLANLILFL